MNATNSKFLMTIKESKKKSISQIAAIGRKHKVLKYPILLFLVLYIFVYNFVYYFCTYFKMKERMAKAVAMAMCVVLCVTSIDITAFAFTGEAGSGKNIVGITSLSDEIANQKVKPDASLEDIQFPESLNVHVTYQVEKEIEVEVEEEKATPTPTPSATPTPSVEPTSTVEPTPSAESVPTEVPLGEEVDTPEENGAENQNVPEQNPPVEEQPEEDNQAGDLQSDATQNEDAENQPDGEQLAKDISGEYDSLETVYVSMGYFAAEPSAEEIVVETLQKDDADDESGDGESESQTVTKKEIIIEEVEEDVPVSVEWSIDEDRSFKAEFKDLEVGEKYVFVPTITEDGYKLADDVELPTITVTIGEVGAFEKSVTVDDVVITVAADEGVFPEGATIEARKVTESEENEVTEAIDEVRSEEKNVAVSYTFDITIRDKEGNEIEPDTSKGSVMVTFKMAEIANENLETDVYHVEETDEGLSAEGLDVNTEEGEADEAAVETEGFSFYTVEFTYGALQYVLEGDEKVELTTILDAVGIKENGEITAVEGSNDELFKPVFDEKEKAWYIEALKPFSTEEWLKVTIDGIEYEIVVTDAQTTGEWSKLQAVLNGTSETSVEGQFDVSSGAGVTTIKLLADFTANSATTLTVNGNKKLDLNGHVINANGNIISVITVSSGATLTLCDSTPDAEHYYKYNYNGVWVWDDSATSGAITVDEITDSTAVNAPILLKGGAITGGKGNVSNSLTYGGGIFNCGNLKIDGGNIVGNGGASTNYGGGIYSIVSFELNVGNIVGNYAQIHGGGVYISQTTGIESHFVMNDGQIIYNAAVDQAGGVYLNSGSFDLYGGSISHNHAQNLGGGVTCLNGTLKMYEGEISYNKTFGTGSSYGFGGGVHNMETMYLYGGRINNNSANYGGGIFNGYEGNPGTLTLTGGIVTENNANSYIGGVYHSSGSISLGGTTQITGNTKSADCQNFYLYPGTLFSIAGDDAPKTEMSIGVTPNAEGMTAISNANDTDYSQHFLSDNDAFSIYYKSDNKLYLAHSSTVTIDLNGGSYPTGSSALADWTYDSTSKKYSKKGSKVTLPDAPTAPAFMKFKGWKYNSNLYDAGTEIVFEKTETHTYTAEYVNIGSSIKTFATPGELTDPNCFTLYTGRGSGIAQKVNFGEKTWYIAGKDEDGSLVLMSGIYDFAKSYFGSNSTYSSSSVRNYLNTTALNQFTVAEQNMMQSTACQYVPAEGDKLYLANGIYDSQYNIWITVGKNNGIAIGLESTNSPTGSPYAVRSESIGEDWFWLRVPHNAGDGKPYVLIALPGLRNDGQGGVHFWGVEQSELNIVPAMNLNLSSVIFASSAPVASASSTFDDGMNFRIAAGEKIGSSATYTRSKVSVTKGTDAGDLYLYVQGKDSSNDWVWSTKVTENSSFDVSSIHDGADLAECAIWLETLNGSDRLAYAKEAGVTSPYTVTLEANGGSGGDESVEVTLYSAMPSITAPTKDDAVFMGYFDAVEGGVKYYNADGTSAKAWDKPSDATLYAHWHTHSWIYIVGTGNDNHHILYAVCSEPECEYYGTAEDVTKAIALIVSVPSRTLTYDGNDFEATVTDTDNKWITIFGSVPSNSYEYKEHAGDSYIIAPNQKDAGYYKASITVDGKTAYVEYQIAKLSITPSVSIDGWTYGATPNTPTVTGNTGTGTVTYKYKKTSEADTAYTTTVPTLCGNYSIKAEIAETKNYCAGSAADTFTISKADRSETIKLEMYDYVYGQDTEPTPSINPAASELEENPSVTYKYKPIGAAEYELWTGDTTALAANNTYEMIAVIEATDSYEEYTTEPTNFNVDKGEWKVTAPTAKTGLIYNCAEQELVNAGNVEDGGTLLYSLDATGPFGDSIPQATDAGEYTVYYKVAEDANHNAYVSETPITVTIVKADWDVTAPIAIAMAPSYTGSALELVNAGVVKDANGSTVANKMLYSLNENGDYSATIPTAIEVGTYTVYYKVASDDNHNEYAVKSMTATIEKADRPSVPTVTMTGYTYGQTDNLPNPDLSETPSDDPTVTYYYNTTESYDDAVKWENITATSLDAGTYYMFASLSETDNYRRCNTSIISFVISKAESTCTAPSAKQNLKYTGQNQELVTGGATDDGTMKYCLTEDGEYSENIPVGKDANEYTVYYKVVGDKNHNDSTPSSVTVSIGKGEWNITSPVAKSGLTYNCAEQELVNAGSAEDGGTLLYSTNGTDYFGNIPKATNAGTYNVYYKIEADTNHSAYECEEPITATIAKADWNVTVPTAIAPSYTGSAQALVNAGVVKDVNGSTVADKMLYSLTGNDDYSTAIPTATTVGSYTVYYKVDGDDNHNEYAVKTMTATIEKISRTDMPTVSMEGYAYGQTGSIPTPSLSLAPSENPTITYYYASENDFAKASEWKNITATTLNAGTYYMFAKLSETASYREDHTTGVEFTIAKGTCTVTAPTGKTLKYNAQARELINKGSVVGGAMWYSLTGNDDYSLTVPTADEVGTYTVYYKVVGDANHEDIAAQTVTATIGKGEHAVTAPKALNLVYNGNEQVLISAGSCLSGTILYSLDGETYTASISEIKGKDIASYTVYYKVEGNTNYDAYGPKQITAKIDKKADPTPTPEPPTPTPDPDPSPAPEPKPTPDPIQPTPTPEKPIPTPTPENPNPVIPIEPKPTDTIPVTKLEESEEENVDETDESGTLGDITNSEETEQSDMGIKVRTMRVGDGNVRVDSEASEKSPIKVANVETPIAEMIEHSDIFTETDIEEINTGADARVWLNVDEMDMLQLSEKEKNEVLEIAKSLGSENEGILYFDISLLKQIGNGDIAYIRESKMDIEVSLKVPEEIRNTNPNVERKYSVIRIHDEKVENLGGDYNEETGYIVFRTGKFSTYVLAYADKPINSADEISDTDSVDIVVKEGNITSLAVILSLILLVGLGLIVFFAIRRRKKEQ